MTMKANEYKKWLKDYIDFCVENLVECQKKGHGESSLIRHQWHLDGLIECYNKFNEGFNIFDDLVQGLKNSIKEKKID